MRVVVDLDCCQVYAQCCYAGPDHFEVRGHEILFYDPVPPEVKRAQQACPVRVIAVQPAGLAEGDGP